MIYLGLVPDEVEPETLMQGVAPVLWVDDLCVAARKTSRGKGQRSCGWRESYPSLAKRRGA